MSTPETQTGEPIHVESADHLAELVEEVGMMLFEDLDILRQFILNSPSDA